MTTRDDHPVNSEDHQGSSVDPFASPGYRRVLLSACCYYLTVGGAYPLLVLQTQALGGEHKEIAGGAVIGLPLFITVVAASYWGRYTDGLGVRAPTLAILLMMGGLLFLPMAWLTTWPLVAVRTLQMGLLASSVVIYNSLVSEFSTEAKGTSLGYFNLASGLGWGTGGLVVGFLIPEGAYGEASFEVQLALGLMALASIIAGLLLFRLPEPSFTPERGSVRDLLNGPERRPFLLILITAFLLMAGYNQLIVFFPDYILKLTDSTRLMGLFFAAAGILGSLFGGLIGRFTDSHGRRTSIRFALVSYVLAMGLYSAVAYVPVHDALVEIWDPLPALLVGVAWTIPLWFFFMIAAGALVSDLSRPRQRGRAMGLLQSAIYLGMGLGAITAGLLNEYYPYWQVFASGTLVVLLAALVGFLLPETQKASRTKPGNTKEA